MRTLVAVFVSTLAIGACGLSEPLSQDRTAASGKYALRTINDTAPPYTLVASSALTVQILFDTLNLTADGNYAEISHYLRTTTTGTDFPIDTVKGTWVILGATVSFQASTGDESTAFLQSSTLTVVGGGLTTVYSK